MALAVNIPELPNMTATNLLGNSALCISRAKRFFALIPKKLPSQAKASCHFNTACWLRNDG